MSLVIESPSVLFRDDVFVVLNKPPGMPSQSTRRGSEGCLEAWLRGQDGVNYTAFHHRLDAAAQGLICASLDRRANPALAAAFRERTARREYRALVHGQPVSRSGRWHHLHRKRGNRRLAVDFEPGAAGEEMISDWEFVESRVPYSLIEVRLTTGRTHQIRLQSAAEGHPILGDRTYGFSETGGLRRQACRLETEHPLSGELLSWELQEPEAWGS